MAGADRVRVLDHPLIQHKLALVRDCRTGPKELRELVEELALLMGYEVTRDLRLEEVEVRTPIAAARCRVLAGPKLGVVPILRAGLCMVGGITRLIPWARVGHMGIYRDPATLQPVEYYCKLPPDLSEREVIVVDPMLATGGSAVAAVDAIKKRGGSQIKFMCLIAAPEGVDRLTRAHPDLDIFTAAIDERLNDHGYIVPGLGDAGDRLFGTR
ncbi:MAG: uracil phosphoribosyltransferase [Acetobacteraceae bacterium]|nr:uracil phosphoribosyltransferase [Acetobacteraceae bacterium]